MLLLFLFPIGLLGQEEDVYRGEREAWLKKNEQYKPVLHNATLGPVQVVEIVGDESSCRGCKMLNVSGIGEFYQSLSKAWFHPDEQLLSCMELPPVYFIRKYHAKIFE